MLRALVALLLLANLAFWAWSEGALDGLGLGPTREHDPQRMTQQVRPETVRVLPPAAAAAALAAASAPPTNRNAQRATWICLEAGPFTGSGVEAAERALAEAALPVGAWVRVSQDVAAQYAVAVGPFVDAAAANKTRVELERLKMTAEAIDLPGATGKAQPALALGRFEDRSAADVALATFKLQGAHDAHVVLLRPAGSESRLRVENASPDQAEQLRRLSTAALGAGFVACPGVAASR